MPHCVFVTDLHGRPKRYHSLFHLIGQERPAAVFLGGDLLPHGFGLREPAAPDDFFADFLGVELDRLRTRLGGAYPRVFVIMGNDDPRMHEPGLIALADRGLCAYVHQRHAAFEGYDVFGYACVPPTPFRLKDWERYDVSRYTDLGCIAPEDGLRTVPAGDRDIRSGTIRDDLETLVRGMDLERAIFLFHSPPYRTRLDRAALDGRMIDHVQVDVHVGSVAIGQFITRVQPWLTLHGHIHESTRLTGAWSERIGRTTCFNAAHDGPELAVIRFDPDHPEDATRALIG